MSLVSVDSQQAINNVILKRVKVNNIKKSNYRKKMLLNLVKARGLTSKPKTTP